MNLKHVDESFCRIPSVVTSERERSWLTADTDSGLVESEGGRGLDTAAADNMRQILVYYYLFFKAFSLLIITIIHIFSFQLFGLIQATELLGFSPWSRHQTWRLLLWIFFMFIKGFQSWNKVSYLHSFHINSRLFLWIRQGSESVVMNVM